MKVLGVVQLQQKKFKYLGFEGAFRDTFGNVPKSFHAIIYGKSGQGKTELCIQLAKYLTNFGEVLWLSYEQGHGADLQAAVNRNNMEEVKPGRFKIADPTEKPTYGCSFLEDLVNYLKKRGSADFVFVDSVDYTGFKAEDYFYLKELFKNKGFIWIGHGQGSGHRKPIGTTIEFDGHIGIRVDKYIGHVTKNRFSSFEPYIIYEERARLLNPKFFLEYDKVKAEKAALKQAEERNNINKLHELAAKEGG